MGAASTKITALSKQQKQKQNKKQQSQQPQQQDSKTQQSQGKANTVKSYIQKCRHYEKQIQNDMAIAVLRKQFRDMSEAENTNEKSPAFDLTLRIERTESQSSTTSRKSKTTNTKKSKNKKQSIPEGKVKRIAFVTRLASEVPEHIATFLFYAFCK